MKNKYIYVFDYSFGHIYEITITKEEFDKIIIANIETWLFKHYRINYKNSDFMISDKKLEIESIEKV